MALGDYILCCKCEVKLIYDGDRDNREWWAERFGAEPEIMCPDCHKEKQFVGLTEEEIDACWDGPLSAYQRQHIREMEQALKKKNGGTA